MWLKLKNHLEFLTICVVLLCVAVAKADFPNDPQPCKFKDTDCIGERIKYYVENKFEGDDSINLPQFDPLEVPLVPITTSSNNPINIDLQLKNNIITGLKDAKLVKVSGFGPDMTKKNQLIFNVKRFRMRGDYTVKGNVVLLPVRGSGKHDLSAYDATITMQFHGKPEERNGATYMQIENMTGSIDAKRVTYKFENLFNNNKALSDNMNAFLNENWQDIWNEIRGNLAHGLQPATLKIYNDVFATMPYKAFFAQE